MELRKTAHRFEQRDCIQIRFRAEESIGMLEWISGFWSQRSQLSTKEAEATSFERAVRLNVDQIAVC
jgi:hypothetical protein